MFRINHICTGNNKETTTQNIPTTNGSWNSKGHMRVNNDKTISWLSIYQEFLSIKEKKMNSKNIQTDKPKDIYKQGDEKNYNYKIITSRMAVIQIDNSNKRK